MLQNGEIVESGTHSRLIEKNGIFARMWEKIIPKQQNGKLLGGKNMIKILQRRFALSEQGAVDLIKGCIACVAQDISFMLPVGLLYYFVIDTMNGA